MSTVLELEEAFRLPYLQPAPDAPLIADIFLSKTGFEILLLWNNYYKLEQKEYWEQEEKSPRKPKGKRTSNVCDKQGDVHWISRVLKGASGHNCRYLAARMNNGVIAPKRNDRPDRK